MDPKLLALMGDKRFKCFVSILKRKECDMLNVDYEKLMAGDEQEKEKVYKFLPELDRVRKSGYDIVGRLVELANRLKDGNISDLAVAVGVMINVMFGREVSPEDAEKVAAVVDEFKCIQFDQYGVSVDSECLERINVPDELKDQIKGAVAMANLAFSWVWSE
jgi:hypothetical protein